MFDVTSRRVILFMICDFWLLYEYDFLNFIYELKDSSNFSFWKFVLLYRSHRSFLVWLIFNFNLCNILAYEEFWGVTYFYYTQFLLLNIKITPYYCLPKILRNNSSYLIIRISWRLFFNVAILKWKRNRITFLRWRWIGIKSTLAFVGSQNSSWQVTSNNVRNVCMKKLVLNSFLFLE